MPILTNPQHEQYAQHRAIQAMSSRDAYAAVFKVKRPDVGASRLNGNKKILARIAELQFARLANLVIEEMRTSAGRVRAKSDRIKRLQQIVKERSEAPEMQEVPGGKTGLLCRDVKAIGAGVNSQIVPVFEVDAAVLTEMRLLEVDIAKELGQWVEKRDDTVKVASISDLSDEALAQVIAEADKAEKAKAQAEKVQ